MEAWKIFQYFKSKKLNAVRIIMIECKIKKKTYGWSFLSSANAGWCCTSFTCLDIKIKLLRNNINKLYFILIVENMWKEYKRQFVIEYINLSNHMIHVYETFISTMNKLKMEKNKIKRIIKILAINYNKCWFDYE